MTTDTRPAQPTGAASIRHKLNRADLVEDVTWMAQTGETAPGAAARVHLHPSRLRERLSAAGRLDLWAVLLANLDTGYGGPRGTVDGAPTTRRAA